MNNVLDLFADVVHHSAVTFTDHFLKLYRVILKFDNFVCQFVNIPFKILSKRLLRVNNFGLFNLADFEVACVALACFVNKIEAFI